MVKVSRRRRAREWVLRALYAGEITEQESPDPLSELLAHDPPGDIDAAFARRLYDRVRDDAHVYDAEISAQLENWDLARLALIDHLLIRMALVEFDDFPDVPMNVTINETLELAKRYSGSQSSAFINGVLDPLMRRRQPASVPPNGTSPGNRGST